MYISKVKLVNYRNFKNSFFNFNKGINTIIGENGDGKTNVFRAMRLLLEDNLYQYAYKLNENDFNRSLGSWKGHWIIISIEFSELVKDESIQALFIHGTGVLEDDYVDKATYNLFFRPKANIRHQLSELEEGDKEGLNTVLDSITIKDYETIFTGKSSVDLNDTQTYIDLVGDFENVNFNFNIDTSKYGTPIPHQLSISKEISFTFIQALRDVVSDFKNNRTNPLVALLKSLSDQIDEEEYRPVSESVKILNQSIEGLSDVQKVRKNIKDTIKEAVGETYSPSSLSIKSNLSDDPYRLLQSLKLFVGEPDETYEGGVEELSLGGANLIFLTLKLLSFKYQKAKETFANFLLIEEPEAHIHTHIQKTLFDNIRYGDDTQIIYSTHSTQLSEVSNVSNMNILVKKTDYAEVYQPSNGLSVESLVKLERYLDAVRSNLLFAKGVILIEGDAEEILIPLMVKKILGISLDELGISLINIRSVGFENIAQIFSKDRIRRRCAIITDLDKAIIDTTILEADTDKIKKYKRRLLKSQTLGEERKSRLTEFAEDNDYIEIYYADHTFEVDFITAGNAAEAGNCIDDIYIDDDTIRDAESEINSDYVEDYGARIIKMANNIGKGWFALTLAKYITHETFIPNYIWDALLFSASNFKKEIIFKIVCHRMKENEYDTDLYNEITNHLSRFVENEIEIDELKGILESLMDDDNQIVGIIERVY